MIEFKLHLSVKNMDVGQDMYTDVTRNHFVEVPHRISRFQGKCHAELNMIIRHYPKKAFLKPSKMHCLIKPTKSKQTP